MCPPATLSLTPDDPIRMLAALWPLAWQHLDPSPPPPQNVNTIFGREPVSLAQAGQMMDSDPTPFSEKRKHFGAPLVRNPTDCRRSCVVIYQLKAYLTEYLYSAV